MRVLSLGLFFALAFPALAAPQPATPRLFSKDPLSIHKRDIPAPAEPLAAIVAPVEEEDPCSTVCSANQLDDSPSLCSYDGLKNTLQCALCIDNAWKETTWEDSAMAEYERIVEACQKSKQKILQRRAMRK